MKDNELLWKSQQSENDSDAPPPRSREIRRSCGQLLGRLDGLLPCIYLAQHGASEWDMRKRYSDTAQGVFAIGERSDMGERPGVAPRMGLLLPVNLCRDERARASLLKIPPLIAGATDVPLSAKRRQVQACLDEGFGKDLKLDDRETFDGFLALTPTPSLFQRLHESFDYVIEVVDNPKGLVRAVKTAPFHWRSYGELMEWYHFLHAPNRFAGWKTLTPYLVWGNTGTLPSYNTERYAREGLLRPKENPARWFVLRPDLPVDCFAIRLEMEEAGWASLHLMINDDDSPVRIALSYVFDPFPDLVAWVLEIDEGDLPVAIEIDEEGVVAVLTVLPTNDPLYVLLRVTRKYGDEDTILLEGIVMRPILADDLKRELCRFFMTEFDPQQWDLEPQQGERVKAYVLSRPWLFPSNGQ